VVCDLIADMHVNAEFARRFYKIQIEGLFTIPLVFRPFPVFIAVGLSLFHSLFCNRMLVDFVIITIITFATSIFVFFLLPNAIYLTYGLSTIPTYMVKDFKEFQELNLLGHSIIVIALIACIKIRTEYPPVRAQAQLERKKQN